MAGFAADRARGSTAWREMDVAGEEHHPPSVRTVTQSGTVTHLLRHGCSTSWRKRTTKERKRHRRVYMRNFRAILALATVGLFAIPLFADDQPATPIQSAPAAAIAEPAKEPVTAPATAPVIA